MLVRDVWLTLVATTILLLSQPFVTLSQQEKDGSYWYEAAREQILRRLAAAEAEEAGGGSGGGGGTWPRRARNVVLAVGDGMGVATTTAARILAGQRAGGPGEDHHLLWDDFPAVAMVRTYNADAQVGESSACATALLCGVKTNLETVGLDARGRFEDCPASLKTRVPSLATWAQEQGKWTGLVTTARVTHGTPAALYGHAASRHWEDDARMPPAARRLCKDLARQLLEDDPGKRMNVVLGGGRRHWLPTGTTDMWDARGREGRRLDGRDLAADWVRSHRRRGLRAAYVRDAEELAAVDLGAVEHLLGLFAHSHLEFAADRTPGPRAAPSLLEMAEAATRLLRRGPRGFFLLLEGGRIDHAHHHNNAFRALDETLALEAALRAVLALLDPRDTLVVLASDHGSVLSLGGLGTPRGRPVLGADNKVSDVDGLPYSLLLYGNGPGHAVPRPVPANDSWEPNAIHAAAAPRIWATHGGEDVPVYARGPLANVLFSGSVDQSYVPHAVAYIACLAHWAHRCDNRSQPAATHHRAQHRLRHRDFAGAGTACPGAAPAPDPPVVSGVMADESASKPWDGAAAPAPAALATFAALLAACGFPWAVT